MSPDHFPRKGKRDPFFFKLTSRVRGEIVFLIAPPEDVPDLNKGEIIERLQERLSQQTLKDEVKYMAHEHNISKSLLYKLALEIKDKR